MTIKQVAEAAATKAIARLNVHAADAAARIPGPVAHTCIGEAINHTLSTLTPAVLAREAFTEAALDYFRADDEWREAGEPIEEGWRAWHEDAHTKMVEMGRALIAAEKEATDGA